MLVEVLNDPANQAQAREGLMLCGPDAVRALRAGRSDAAKKMFGGLDNLVRERCANTSGVDQQTALLMIGELDRISSATEKQLILVLEQSRGQDQLHARSSA